MFKNAIYVCVLSLSLSLSLSLCVCVVGYQSSGPASITLWPELVKKMRVLIYNGAQKRLFGAVLIPENDRFAKTGSGQT